MNDATDDATDDDDATDATDAVDAPAPPTYLLNATTMAGEDASYAVLQCSNGWYEHFVSGPQGARRYHRYVSNETLENLDEWWMCEFASYELHHMSADDAMSFDTPLRSVSS